MGAHASNPAWQAWLFLAAEFVTVVVLGLVAGSLGIVLAEMLARL